MDNYERIRMLGQGSYGKAWLVQDRSTDARLVIKEIRVNHQKEMDEALAEAEVLSKLDHINIIKFAVMNQLSIIFLFCIKLNECGQQRSNCVHRALRYSKLIRVSPKVVCIVMEYADDGDLSDKIGRRRVTNQLFDEASVLKTLVQVVQALFYLHSRGILHRDIKTANLFLNKSGVVKLGDFGIARILDDNAERMSARTCSTPIVWSHVYHAQVSHCLLQGTPLYMSPELCQGAKYGQKVDMWALGCALYEVSLVLALIRQDSIADFRCVR